jgi:hypothetical protein
VAIQTVIEWLQANGDNAMHEPTKVCIQCGHLALYSVVVCPRCKKVFEQETDPNRTAYVPVEVDPAVLNSPQSLTDTHSAAAKDNSTNKQTDLQQATLDQKAQQALEAEKAAFRRNWLEKYGRRTSCCSTETTPSLMMSYMATERDPNNRTNTDHSSAPEPQTQLEVDDKASNQPAPVTLTSEQHHAGFWQSIKLLLKSLNQLLVDKQLTMTDVACICFASYGLAALVCTPYILIRFWLHEQEFLSKVMF